MNPEIVYLGHDNWIDAVLKEDGSAKSMSAATKMTLTFGSLLVDSTNDAADPILWAKEGYLTGQIRIKLGQVAIPAGSYDAPLVVYDASNPNGIVWGEIPIQVNSEVEADEEPAP